MLQFFPNKMFCEKRKSIKDVITSLASGKSGIVHEHMEARNQINREHPEQEQKIEDEEVIQYIRKRSGEWETMDSIMKDEARMDYFLKNYGSAMNKIKAENFDGPVL